MDFPVCTHGRVLLGVSLFSAKTGFAYEERAKVEECDL